MTKVEEITHWSFLIFKGIWLDHIEIHIVVNFTDPEGSLKQYS